MPATASRWLRRATEARLRAMTGRYDLERYQRYAHVERYCENRYRQALGDALGYLGR